jgi:hypothetical protein
MMLHTFCATSRKLWHMHTDRELCTATSSPKIFFSRMELRSLRTSGSRKRYLRQRPLFAIDSPAVAFLEMERAAQLAPWEARMLVSAGVSEVVQGRETEGLAKVHRAVALDPRNVDILDGGAAAGQFLALPEEMERYAATELSINPDLIEPYGELFDAAIARHDIPLLRARLDTFSRAHPEREIEVKYAILAGGQYVERARRKAVHDLSASKPPTTPSDSLTNLMKDVSLFLAVGDKTTARVLATSAL